ncbi:UDP-3-O-(3-hydroxymyristoyl)glucosamine N-acyltransferase [Parachitinimonas caeni]|uniref:UDP-3-O-acylglucosamine N-acyltransferase n=1 Tax=Parachitinimonas caeni TaxID=3031301 RepID=A0ABT7DX52_9NEIS|nr:UDP-3-O-(3-hydroxymyristoyl)glucosamine N-acyltransferase [Parachitinimonas caeni]MDK2124625.1 UDP-3-O-(3-hydroxymyristoyl)glucosamine N-acyltransferase [Parachitinimonas caeni]
MSYRLSELVDRFGGEWLGSDVVVSQVASLENADSSHISFLSNPKYRKQLSTSRAGAIIVEASLRDAITVPRIVCANPYLYFAKVSSLLNPRGRPAPGIHPSAVIHSSAVVDASAHIGPHVSIGEGVVVGADCILHPGVQLAAYVQLGSGCELHANVVIYQDCILGNRVTLHSGAVIGADGFGLAWDADHWFKIPQIGRVLIGDDVEIGASTTVDRGALNDTIIEEGAKLDNQIQIGHNVVIGAHSALAGCVGVAGSTRIGRYCTFGGSAMILGHLDIADKVNVMAGTLVGKSIRQAGTYTGWYPVQKHEDWLTNASHLRHLDALAKRVKELEIKIAQLDTQGEHNKEGDKP